MLTNFFSNPVDSIFSIIILIIAITIHEYAHAWSAYYLGDDTPKIQGRVSINPLHHLDPMGTIFMLFAGFGWGKPVMTNIYNFRKPRIDYAITSLAGPLANLALAIVCSLPKTVMIIIGNYSPSFFIDFFEKAYYINLLLFVFNLLPIYPLDGSKLVMVFIKKNSTLQKYMSYGPPILYSIVFLEVFLNIPILSWTILSLSFVFTFIIRGLIVTLLT